MQEVARAKKSTAGGLEKSRRCRYLGFLVRLFFWIWLRPLVSGHRGFLGAHIAMIPKGDGDSTP